MYLGSPTEQAWILIQEMGALKQMWMYQEHPSLPPEEWLDVLE